MDLKKYGVFFAILHKIVVIIAVAFTIMAIMNSFSNRKIYDNSAENILSEYRNRNNQILCTTSLLENSELDVNVMSFSGNQNIGKITAANKTTLQLSGKQFLGEGKLLMENKVDGKIVTILLTENIIELEKGEYEIFLSGKGLFGNVMITADSANAVSIDIPEK